MTDPTPLPVFITQRLVHAGPDAAGHDGLDRRWHDRAQRWGVRLVPLPNDPDAAEFALCHGTSSAGIILSGGGDLSGVPGGQTPDAVREQVERTGLDWARSLGRAVLGVCRGAQLLWRDAGGTLTAVTGHTSGTHALVPTADGTDAGVGPGVVNSFHAYRCTGEPEGLVTLAGAGDGTVEAFSSRAAREVGILWHPERPGNTVSLDLLLKRLFARKT
ncbi:putative glutamine amidotransferase [Streptomyces sp. 2224.1]|uniref:gamma-glutamyl-gamma-aminobutyrate hydrolase family protein n=1 Tax=unclassified Streptomyces TaxID=2593676 RepID=UPI000885818D|nr:MULTISPECIES: gamma-glutamyl-gamma-aminobutyrate hydrolase family protein [unclassified Streptomyces]PBC82471.1 putative glutamine amidotransferase [Streptomyces sp. 2321.6]SDR49479.1 putative glutamine amidotransferase [Streptomyces sp. KS_16]SEC45256.1 putative glutamine amidotransferase [Streptomyces sp. 2224.1]SEC59231.1 putative glutamine amidotransferase [Streptomyces sp. 2133.1]SNC68470.1 putative glutamine amidotransferase [Streptomyces sp. 2114.4]